jgi:hypothetical protein
MNFNSRETYLVAVAQWKAEYAAHSLAIRQLKHDRSNLQREGKDVYRTLVAITVAKNQATEMINERLASKEAAQAQYEEARVKAA